MATVKKVTIKSPGQRPETEKAKKIYSSVCDIIKRLDETQVKKKVCRDAFHSEVVLLRDRLQEYCEKLMFTWPLEYGRKVEDVLWRKAFYDVIQLIKHNIKDVKADISIEQAYKTHLSSALGYYNRLLSRIESEFNLQSNDIFYLFRPQRKLSKWDDNTSVKTWATQACFRCHMYLGDIARYQYDYEGSDKKMLAQKYYYQAASLSPGVGMPFNQLGTLAGSSVHAIHAAYYYIRCLTSSVPFEGSHNNLIKLFERNRKKLLEFEQANNSNDNNTQHSFLYNHNHRRLRKNAFAYNRSKDSKKFLIRFIHLVELFYCSTKDCDKSKVYKLCQEVLDDFSHCLNNLSINKSFLVLNREKQNCVDDEVIFKIFIICFSLIHLLSKKGNDLVAAAIAFSLAMFSHALHSVTCRIQPNSSMLDINEVDEEEEEKRNAANAKKSSAIKTSEKTSKINLSINRDNINSKDSKNDRNIVEEIVDVNNYKNEAENESADTNLQEKGKSVKKWKKSILKRRRKRGNSGDDDEEEDEKKKCDGDDDDDVVTRTCDSDDNKRQINDQDDESSSDVESETAMDNLSDLESLSTSHSEDDGGSDMASQEEEEESVRLPSYHKKDKERPSKMILSSKPKNDQPNNEDVSPSVVNGVDSDDNVTSLVENQQCSDDVLQCSKDNSGLVLNDSTTTSMPMSNATTGEMEKTTINESNFCNFSSQWMSNAASFLGNVLKTSYFEEKNFSDIISGSKNVPVPPGFERSSELQHVLEITEKLANFNIETDTDVNQTDGDNSTAPNSDVEAELQKEGEKKKQELHKKEVSRILHVISSEMMLEYIKVFCDWMVVNPAIVTSCAKISSSIWYRLAALLNILPTERDLFESDVSSMFAAVLKKEMESELVQTSRVFPILEDIHLRQFPPLKVAHQRIDYDKTESLNSKEQSIIRLCRLRMFCRTLTTLDGIDFTYNEESDLFRGPLLSSVNINSSQDGINKTTEDRNQMMKNLAQLRLKSQMDQTTNKNSNGLLDRGFPIYLILDTETCCEARKNIQQLALNEKFSIIVPKVVLLYLDSLKVSSRSAMKAIEWLESELGRKSQVRMQKPHETCQPLDAKQMKPNIKESHDYILSLIDCCNYFLTSSRPMEHNSVEEDKQSRASATATEEHHVNSVCLLTWMTEKSPELSEHLRTSMSQAIERGIQIKTIGEFTKQWKQIS